MTDDRVECFVIQRTAMVRLSLRRTFVADVPGRPAQNCSVSEYGYHQARFEIGEEPRSAHVDEEGRLWARFVTEKDDPRWPKSCACGYVFKYEDPWHRDVWEIYEGCSKPSTEEQPWRADWRGVLHDAPAGAMWDADWLGKFAMGPDALHLMIKLPDGNEWLVDGPANDGGKWSRTGEWPKVTATPSILTRTYHGWLTDGHLVRC